MIDAGRSFQLLLDDLWDISAVGRRHDFVGDIVLGLHDDLIKIRHWVKYVGLTVVGPHAGIQG